MTSITTSDDPVFLMMMEEKRIAQLVRTAVQSFSQLKHCDYPDLQVIGRAMPSGYYAFNPKKPTDGWSFGDDPLASTLAVRWCGQWVLPDSPIANWLLGGRGWMVLDEIFRSPELFENAIRIPGNLLQDLTVAVRLRELTPEDALLRAVTHGLPVA